MRVSEIFRSIQGEGVNVGIPMTFARLQGCTVGCAWCDTKYSWAANGGSEMSIEDIVDKCDDSTVCITGGEPAQCDASELSNLVKALKDAGKFVCIETSGVGSVAGMGCVDHMTLSPKGHIEPGREFFALANEIKVVILKAADVERALDYRRRYARPAVLLQPVGGSPTAMKICLEAAKHYGFRLSIQIHKVLGVR